jgi:hypothetical protein
MCLTRWESAKALAAAQAIKMATQSHWSIFQKIKMKRKLSEVFIRKYSKCTASQKSKWGV